MKIAHFHFPAIVLFFLYIPTPKGIPHMTNIVRSAEYRYFSFTYFYGKAYLGLAECVRV